jgi:hypothetical protein
VVGIKIVSGAFVILRETVFASEKVAPFFLLIEYLRRLQGPFLIVHAAVETNPFLVLE